MLPWIITGWYEGCQYAAYGTDTTVTVPDWLWESLQLDTEGGIVDSGGVPLRVGNLASMTPDGVVAVLEAMTTIEQASGQLPPRHVTPVFDGVHPVH